MNMFVENIVCERLSEKIRYRACAVHRSCHKAANSGSHSDVLYYLILLSFVSAVRIQKPEDVSR